MAINDKGEPPVRTGKPTGKVTSPLTRIATEIAILKKLHHPNVVRLIELCANCTNWMFFGFSPVMEVPTDDPLDEETAWRYLRDTLLGLEYLHFQKIVHRDIKPSNLLLSNTGSVKIADFGVSSQFTGVDAYLSGTVGTPAFVAPEALRENSNQFYSGRAQDIWSLGITLYAFVYGNVPFVDSNIAALYEKIRNEPLEQPKKFPDRIPSNNDSFNNYFRTHVSHSLQELISCMLEKDPGHRYTLNEIMHHRWVIKNGTSVLTQELKYSHLVKVTDEEVQNSVKVVPRLDTVILNKSMVLWKHFGNPFRAKPSNSEY
ncbi:unnamed protein product [Soboliphyme baturini]|uniref:Protein kinase domain-containing protein n=1 Tax=Soboliphyme baturini TaxID=241478 RepID=A0A183IBQ3_9BILA|nr:unnamed protein product [Soboliphyme baturini]